jgi:hypothetical protein
MDSTKRPCETAPSGKVTIEIPMFRALLLVFVVLNGTSVSCNRRRSRRIALHLRALFTHVVDVAN